MTSKQFVFILVLALITLIFGGCAAGTEIGMPNPAAVHCEEQGYSYEIRTAPDGGQYGVCIFPDGSECDGWAFFRGVCGPGGEDSEPEEVPVPDPDRARDVALNYVSRHYAERAPGPDLNWTEENVTAEGLVGASDFRYTAGDWVISVSFPVVAPQDTVYQVVMTDQATGFHWEGEVDAAGQVTEKVTPVEEAYQPLSPTQCEELANAAQQTLGVEVVTSEAPFEDYVSGEEGTGCRVTATGTGLEFESYWSVAEDLKAMLADRGWQEDMMYAADGPTGTAAGFRKGDGLCLLNVGWKPSDDADCPEDQPIATCDLKPEQQLYSIVLNCAKAAAGEAYAGWNTYTSETFGYTLKYPGDAEVMGADPDRAVQFVGPVVDGEHWPWFSVNHPDADFYRPPAGTDVHQWIEDSDVAYDEVGSDTEIAGLPAVHLITHASPQAYGSDDYYFIKGDQLFHISILHAGGKQDWGLYEKFSQSFTFD